MNSTDFHVLLGHFRHRVGLSQERFAEQLGCSRKSIIEWEKQRGNNPKDRDTVLRMGSTLRLSESELTQLLEAAGFLAFDAKRDGFGQSQLHSPEFVSIVADKLVEVIVKDLAEIGLRPGDIISRWLL